MDDGHEEVGDELRRVRDQARRHPRSDDLQDPEPTPAPGDPPAQSRREPGGEAGSPPAPPDAAAVNAGWRTAGPSADGPTGLLRRLVERILRPRLHAQQAFNSAQVQLDNALLEYLEKRSAATHRHYDRLLGDVGRRLDEIDERHAILEKELVGHVQDLVHRIDLVLADESRGRLGLEFALEEVRGRLDRLEKSLRSPE